MTLSKPEPGEMFGHTGWKHPLTYVGALTDGRWVLESSEGAMVDFQARTAITELYPYLEPVLPLEPGQHFRRTRHDYSGQTAEVLAVFKGAVLHDSDGGKDAPLWVAYLTHPNNNGREPKLKDETSFRRIFGTRADPVPASQLSGRWAQTPPELTDM